jgi:hypothetical protein
LEKLKAGGETSAYCTSCKDMRHHVVVAMKGDVPAKVECLSCHKQHKFKAGPPAARWPSQRESKRPVPKVEGRQRTRFQR